MSIPAQRSALDPRPAALAGAVVEPDAATWDAFARLHPYGHLLQSSTWGALKSGVGWEARRVTIAGPGGPYAGTQLLLRRRLGLSAAYVPRGPLFTEDQQATALLLGALDRVARLNRAVFLRLEPNVLEDDPQADSLHSTLLLHGFQVSSPLQPRSTLHLDLTPAPDQLLAAMSKGHRADIRRAAREGVSVRAGERPSDFDAFYTLMEQTGARAGFAIHSRAYYQAAWELFSTDGHALLALAEHGGQTIAACMVFAWAGTGLYLYGGSNEAGLKSGANHALQWFALQWAREQGCTLYDFWGIPDALGRAATTDDAAERARLEAEAQADSLHGVFRFKKGFGGRFARYLPAYDRVYIPALYALWRRRFSN
jgi:serine/alanine adding enzyme